MEKFIVSCLVIIVLAFVFIFIPYIIYMKTWCLFTSKPISEVPPICLMK